MVITSAGSRRIPTRSALKAPNTSPAVMPARLAAGHPVRCSTMLAVTMFARVATDMKLTSISPAATIQVRPRNIRAAIAADTSMLSMLPALANVGRITARTTNTATTNRKKP